MTRRILTLLSVLGVGTTLLAFTPRSDGQTGQTVPTIKHEPCVAIASMDGKDNFLAYCAVCHGRDAKGHGPASPALKMPVPDLTTLALRSGGKFNFLAVERVIAGSDKMPAAHGTAEMPMWGPVFRSAGSDPALTTQRIKNMVRHIESIQQSQ